MAARDMGAAPLRIEARQWRYRAMIGVGGIGAGSFFALEGDHTLGREESRAGRFLDRRDYCKLHIVSHYVQTLLGLIFSTIPVGRVGDDDPHRPGRSPPGEPARRGQRRTGRIAALFPGAHLLSPELGKRIEPADQGIEPEPVGGAQHRAVRQLLDRLLQLALQSQGRALGPAAEEDVVFDLQTANAGLQAGEDLLDVHDDEI